MGVIAQFQALAALTPGRERQYPLNRKPGGPQGRYWCFEENKNSLTLARSSGML